jgi:hypothetical protein
MHVTEIDEGELAIRMAEAAIGIKRPPGKTQAEVLASFPADWGAAFSRAARAAMKYWGECIEAWQDDDDYDSTEERLRAALQRIQTKAPSMTYRR